jgi:hypothetical protein
MKEIVETIFEACLENYPLGLMKSDTLEDESTPPRENRAKIPCSAPLAGCS